MASKIYGDLVRFYHLLDPLSDHAEEGDEFGAVLRQAVPDARSLLELGSGAGHGAHFLAPTFDEVVLTDLAPAMLGRSQTLNPSCEHILGDMRSLALGRTFDCIMAHDAVCYLTTETDLSATFDVAYRHLRSGGAALWVPDCVTESFVDSHEAYAGDDEERSLRAISWSYDPDPDDTQQIVDFAYLLREQGKVWSLHERHEYGLFPTATWLRLGARAGFDVESLTRPLPPEYLRAGYTEKMFLFRRP